MAVAEHLLIGLGYAPTSTARSLVRLTDTGAADGSATVAEEVPIAFVYNGRPHVVVMGTPSDLEDLAVGFSRTEGIVDDVSQVEHITVVRASHGIELQIQIPASTAARLEDRVRGLVARTGCGLCGVATINDALRMPVQVPHGLIVNAEALWRAGTELAGQQALNNETSTVHAAGWATSAGVLVVVREDVGRHNALDKVLGALARNATPMRDGFIVVTSRASYEMVQKTAVCGIEMLSAISRPTGLAIRFAEAAGVTLVGLLRGRTANVYCGSERIHSS
ncbi:MAG TPA: formate dehydrogenase accessory sulfurtransferase FdhD [Gemmatimonadaceae bacterium]|nr:formate dehydrogenase accessory sulfurtransferase FdhD [Gemmatimonadaceae bacterium]